MWATHEGFKGHERKCRRERFSVDPEKVHANILKIAKGESSTEVVCFCYHRCTQVLRVIYGPALHQTSLIRGTEQLGERNRDSQMSITPIRRRLQKSGHQIIKSDTTPLDENVGWYPWQNTLQQWPSGKTRNDHWVINSNFPPHWAHFALFRAIFLYSILFRLVYILV